MKKLSQVFFVVFALALTTQIACTTPPQPNPSDDLKTTVTPPPTPPTPAAKAAPDRGHHALDALAWTQSSVEWKGLAEQAYRAARFSLDAGLKDKTWTASPDDQTGNFAKKPPAIILDVDETVLDNSPYQARLLMEDKTFSGESWNAWCNESRALAVPGAVEFTQYAASKGVTVFFVTNRSHDVEEATRKNLKEQGFPIRDDIDNLLTKKERKEWTSDKRTRRRFVAEKYRIVQLFGDNFGDFVTPYKESNALRTARSNKDRSFWGTRWIVLPNALYGSWESTLYNNNYKLTEDEKIEAKKAVLRQK